MKNVELRRAELTDALPLGTVHLNCWLETYEGIVPQQMLAKLSADGLADRWRRIIGSMNSGVQTEAFVAVAEKEVVGFCSCGAARDKFLQDQKFDGEFSSIYILRSFQKNGVGRRLMATMAEALYQRGLGSAAVWVLRDNIPARRFYEHLDGQMVGEWTETTPDGPLENVAYGWRSLSLLVKAAS